MYVLKEFRDFVNTYLKLRRSDPIIIYQMGKVGSKSIHNSLKKLNVAPLFHLHSLRHDSMHIQTRMLFDYVNIQRGKAKIITLVREPVERNISSFFQTAGLFTGENFDYANYNVDTLINTFFDKYHHMYPLYWFDYEFRTRTGIDVYNYEFLNNSYSIINQKTFEVLILKTETSDKVKEDAINKFFGFDNFKLERSNQSSDKKYAHAYKEFKNKIIFPSDYINEMYSSKYVKHFYEEKDIAKLKTKWISK